MSRSTRAKRAVAYNRWRTATVVAAGCATILGGVVLSQRRQIRMTDQHHRQRFQLHEEYWQMRYATLQRLSDAKDRARRIADAMEKDLRLGTGRAHVNAALATEGREPDDVAY